MQDVWLRSNVDLAQLQPLQYLEGSHLFIACKQGVYHFPNILAILGIRSHIAEPEAAMIMTAILIIHPNKITPILGRPVRSKT
jgi:hypothetical protein